ncbi:MAG TPA: type II toxin-antitoxin system HicB family antitoxin [Pyrinomonadaceae bacterium]|jgi:predicted RNase H-like HicB family nuclease|nr:type II toxin-antitoxin system HicB family antitoxin [Pyrinomonadaceae bacterium]
MDRTFNAVYLKVPEGYVGFVEELPGVSTQGATLEETRSNLHDAVETVLEANHALTLIGTDSDEVIREPLFVSTRE